MRLAGNAIKLCAAGAVLVLVVRGAAAQQTTHPAAPGTPPARQVAPPKNDGPQSTTATYGDWVVQCQSHTEPAPGQICDMAQVAQLQGKNVPFSRVSIVHPEKGQSVRLIVQVPVNASFSSNVHIQIADSDPGLTAPFASCVPNGCFAQFDLNEEAIKKLRAASTTGKLSFAVADGHEISIPISFNGFSQAFDALAKK